jgi:sarcosine oxidase subunit gamma
MEFVCMVERDPRQAALEHLDHAPRWRSVDGGLGLRALSHTGQINFRGDAGDSELRQAVRGVLGTNLPTEPGRSSTGTTATTLWLGPDEWLITCPPDGVASLVAELERAASGHHASIVDVSDARSVIRISGPKARDLLAKGCSLDLHARVFPVGAVAQCLITKADVVLHHIAETTGEDGVDGSVFNVHVARSMTEYLWLWLTDAAADYRMQPVE